MSSLLRSREGGSERKTESLMNALRKRNPQSKAEVEQVLVDLADTEDFKLRLTQVIRKVNETSESKVDLSNVELFPSLPRDWEEANQTSMESEISRFRLKSFQVLDFTDPDLLCSLTSWTCLKHALIARVLTASENPLFIFPKSLEFINNKLAAMTRPPHPHPHLPEVIAPLTAVRLAVMRWRLYHRSGVAPPRVLSDSEDERKIARNFAIRLGHADEAAVARLILEGDFRQWFVAELLPRLNHRIIR